MPKRHVPPVIGATGFRPGAPSLRFLQGWGFSVVVLLAFSLRHARADCSASATGSVEDSKVSPRSSPRPLRNLGPGRYDGGNLPAGREIARAIHAFGANIANNVYKPGDGPRKVSIGLVNDPLDSCDPAGFPRDLLFELRPFQVVQTSSKLLMLYQYQQVWRVIWKDGRELPKDPDPRWYGYSVGKWEDDYTFVVETVGMDERTWLDNAGDPHSNEMRVRGAIPPRGPRHHGTDGED